MIVLLEGGRALDDVLFDVGAHCGDVVVGVASMRSVSFKCDTIKLAQMSRRDVLLAAERT